MRNRGRVILTADGVAKLLHLRDGMRVTAVEFRLSTEEVHFFLEGPELPPTPKRCEAICVPLSEVMGLE